MQNFEIWLKPLFRLNIIKISRHGFAFLIVFILVLYFSSLWTQCPVTAHQRVCCCSPSGSRSSARTRSEDASARQQEQQTVKKSSMNSYSPPESHQKTHQPSQTLRTGVSLSRRGRSVPSAQHPWGFSTSWRCHSPKTTQINVWKWYLLSSSPWPLTKSTAALSNSANRISTKLNMSKY